MPVATSSCYDWEEVVISGLSGRYPNSDSVKEFRDNLFNGVDMVTDNDKRWPRGLRGLPSRTGVLKDISSFDATYFGISSHEANLMDPELRMCIETTHEAIIDAGFHPEELKGKNIGVFLGCGVVTSGVYWSHENLKDFNPEHARSILYGSCSGIVSKTASVFGFQGPQSSTDTACSSSSNAFDLGLKAIRKGECEAAIICGLNELLTEEIACQFNALKMLSSDGKCRSFDAAGNGYVRAETVCSIFLQKSKDARRIYAKVLHSGMNSDGNKSEGITFPSHTQQRILIESVFEDAGIDPSTVDYVEAHGTGTPVGDPQEAKALEDFFFRNNRVKPLLIGSVKSNMGHAETASGLCSITKVIIAMQELIIPQNLHYETPNPNIPSLIEGRLQVVAKNTNWSGGTVLINNFGFGGSNVTIILESYDKEPIKHKDETIPKLVCVSGTTTEAVEYFLKEIESTPRNYDLITLLHKVHEKNINGHSYRGYTVLGEQTVKFHQVSEVQEKNQVWFVYDGYGGHWAGMGRAYMSLKPFSDAIHKCAKALTDVGFDLLYLINEADESSFKDMITNSVTLTAIQVALTDLLAAIGIKPDGILGHSGGEIGCAYEDGAITAEQAVLVSYWRVRTLVEMNPKPGLMAAVGLTWAEAKARCPDGIYPACHNGENSVTISGLRENMIEFVKQLQDENIFAKILDDLSVSYHCENISEIGAAIQSSLEKVITTPKVRSSKWLSTSIPEENWGTDLAKTFSPAYQTNNDLAPVLFYEVVQKIPPDSTVLEIGPHCLLQGVLKKSLPQSCLSIGLFKKHIPDELANFEANIGKLYLTGLNTDMSIFHNPSPFPVARGTPMISPMIKWDHSKKWLVPDYALISLQTNSMIYEINLSDETGRFLAGHKNNGRVLLPSAAYLDLVWREYAKIREKKINECCVIMENVSFLRDVIVPEEGPVKMSVSILQASGDFEISVDGSLIATGRVRPSQGIKEDGLKNVSEDSKPEERKALNDLSKSDIYKFLRLNGYEYNGLFQGIKNCDNSGGNGILEWKGNWVTYMDCMLQFSQLSKNSEQLFLPKRILKIIIDPQAHLSAVEDKEEVPIIYNDNFDTISSGGIEIRGLYAPVVPKKSGPKVAKLEQYCFVPYNINHETSTEDALTIALQIVLENSLDARKLNVIEAYSTKPPVLFAQDVINVLESEPMCSVNYKISIPNNNSLIETAKKIGAKLSVKDILKETLDSDAHLVITSKLSENSKCLDNALASIKEGQFILSLEPVGYRNFVNETKAKVISQITVKNGIFLLLRKARKINESFETVKITHSSFDWIPVIKKIMKNSEVNHRVLLIADDGQENGIIGLFNCLKQEPGGECLRCIYLSDKCKKFNSALYTKHMDSDLLLSVYKDGKWGSMRHLQIVPEKDQYLEHSFCTVMTAGDMSSFRWIESPMTYLKLSHYPGKEICSIYYSALNFNDIMIASGKLPLDEQADMESKKFGMEFTGRNSKGQRVMGVVKEQALATSTIADPVFLWPIPDRWTMEQASTIPFVYLTCYYAMLIRGNMKKGEIVLIHAGSGGVGQAAIHIALSMDCEVFTTVGSQEKKEFLLETFPKLKPENIGSSRDTSFEHLVLEGTSGCGVDLILNSLSFELFQASLKCLGKGGRFLELGKTDINSNTYLGFKLFMGNRSFHGVSLDFVFNKNANQEEKLRLSKLLADGISTEVVKPLPVVVFDNTAVEQAFRYKASGKHIGKVVVKIRNEEECDIITDVRPVLIPSLPQCYMNPDKSYIIVDGMDGFGFELAQWMSKRGARHIILNSRCGFTTGNQKFLLRRLEEKGHQSIVSTADATTLAGSKVLLREASRFAPVGGIFNLAGVLKDALMINQNKESFEIVFKSKVESTKLLDMISRDLCPELDYFVVFSSDSSGRGNAGQANYGMANSCTERICEKRHADGLPATAIQWGAIGDEDIGGTNETAIAGPVLQGVEPCMSALNSILRSPYPVVSSRAIANTGIEQKGIHIQI